MSPSPHPLARRAHLATLCATVALLSACGGGSDDPAPVQPPGPPPTTATVNTTVIDGPLQNAKVCLDVNGNGACDPDEPSARTAANGAATLTVPIALAGQHALVAEVGTDAVDADHGPVTTPFVLSTPADQASVVSPLSTLVHAHMQASGLGAADAERALQDAGGFTTPLLGNFAAGSGNEAAAAMARLVVLIKQESAASLQPAVGTQDSSGATITAAELDGAVNRRLLELLPTLATVTGDALAVAAGTARNAALLSSAHAVASQDIALTEDNVGWVIGFARQPDAPPSSPAAGGLLDWFTYTDAGNWTFRVFTTTVEQATPDANGLLHFSELRRRAVNGNVQTFGDAGFDRTDVYFNGTSWFNCPADFNHAQTARNADGVNESRYCGAFRNRIRRSGPIDIGGRSMPEVLAQIRSYPLLSTQGPFANWGPDPTTPALAGAVFPAGSNLYQQTSTQLANPDSYGTLDNQRVRVFSAEVAAGGTPVYVNGVPSLACGSVTAANAATHQSLAQTLEQMVARNTGTPCIFTPNANTGPRHEWWSNSTIGLGRYEGPAPAYPFYQADRSVRVAFGANNTVTYLDCPLAAVGDAPRNCDTVGTGTYTIETLGDARVMRFHNLPAAARDFNYYRSFVERGGQVYFGYRTKLAVDNTLRLNLTATDALLAELGLSR